MLRVKLRHLLFQADVDITNLNRKVNLMEDEYEQLSSKLHNTAEKLEETLKAADECEKYISFIFTVVYTNLS